MDNMLMIVSGPSGVGKQTLIDGLLAVFPEIHRTRSCTTKALAEGEDEDYDQLTVDDFLDMVNAGGLAEHRKVHGNWYGTPRSEAEWPGIALAEVDCQGALDLKRQYPHAHLAFILPPPYPPELERRIRTRGREKSEADIQRRLRNALGEIAQARNFDCWVENEDKALAFRNLYYIFLMWRFGSEPGKAHSDLGLLERVQSAFAAVATS